MGGGWCFANIHTAVCCEPSQGTSTSSGPDLPGTGPNRGNPILWDSYDPYPRRDPPSGFLSFLPGLFSFTGSPLAVDLTQYFDQIGAHPCRETISTKRKNDSIRRPSYPTIFTKLVFSTGDLQLKNILVAGDQLLLIDFDRSLSEVGPFQEREDEESSPSQPFCRKVETSWATHHTYGPLALFFDLCRERQRD